MFIHTENPPVEWDHEKACYAEAVISAVQNLRDNPGVGRFEFALSIQGGGHENDLSKIATGYLTDGLQSCTCERTCPHGLPPWKCRPAATCLRCQNDTLVAAGLPVEFTDEEIEHEFDNDWWADR